MDPVTSEESRRAGRNLLLFALGIVAIALICERSKRSDVRRGQPVQSMTPASTPEPHLNPDPVDPACGPLPKPSAWDGIPRGLKRYFERRANDPDSVEFVGCTDVAKNDPPRCWMVTCDVRAKNAFGAKILRRFVFRKNATDWETVSGD